MQKNIKKVQKTDFNDSEQRSAERYSERFVGNMIKNKCFLSKFDAHTCVRYGIMNTRAEVTLQNGAYS